MEILSNWTRPVACPILANFPNITCITNPRLYLLSHNYLYLCSWENSLCYVHEFFKTVCSVDVPKERKEKKSKQWSKDEKKIVHDYFSEHIDKDILPKKDECLRFMDSYKEIIKDRKWTTIKDYVRNDLPSTKTQTKVQFDIIFTTINTPHIYHKLTPCIQCQLFPT